MSWRYEVLVKGKWYDNAVFFDSEAEALRAGENKLWSWTQCDDFRVLEDDRPANYRLDPDSGAIVHIPTEAALWSAGHPDDPE